MVVAVERMVVVFEFLHNEGIYSGVRKISTFFSRWCQWWWEEFSGRLWNKL